MYSFISCGFKYRDMKIIKCFRIVLHFKLHFITEKNEEYLAMILVNSVVMFPTIVEAIFFRQYDLN